MRAGLLLILTLGAVLCMTAQPASARVVDENNFAEMEQSSEYLFYASYKPVLLLYSDDSTLLFRLCPTWFELHNWL